MSPSNNKQTTRLEVINYERLKAKDNTEIQKLIHVCSDVGIFFLDLRAPSARDILQDLHSINGAQLRFFAQNFEVKSAYSSDLEDRGYQRHDDPLVEILELSREEQIRNTLKLPPDLEAVETQLSSVMSFSDVVLRDIFKLLCTSLDPPAPTSAVSNPKNPGKSNLGLGLAAAPMGTSLMSSHADDGILTILYYDVPFLEILEPASQEWKLVEVVEGLQVVNVGEDFRKLSGGRLKAALHRVTQAEGENHLIIYYLHLGSDQ